MRDRSRLKRGTLALQVLLGGCAVEGLQPDYEAARDLVRETTGRQEVFDPEQPPLAAADIEVFLDGGLTLDEALRLALLNNRRLHAAFMQLGVARAEWVQAGLLRNPSLGLAFFFPSGGGRTRLAGEIGQDIMDLWRIPSQRAAAAAGYEQRVFDVARLAGDLVAQTQQAYIETAAARERGSIAAEGASLAEQWLEAVETRIAAGAAAEVDANLLRGVALTAGLEARRAEREETVTSRRLGALLSLESDLLGVELLDGVPRPEAATWTREAAAERARTARLDVRAGAAALTAAEARVELEKARGLPDVEAGVVAERPEGDSDADFLAGPSLSVEIPLFDRNEAGIRRAEANRDAERAGYESLLAEAVQEARAAADGLNLALKLRSTIEAGLLAQAERTVELARQAFDLGNGTSLLVLEAQRGALTARQAWLDARLEVALAEVSLLRSIGGPVPRAEGTP